MGLRDKVRDMRRLITLSRVAGRLREAGKMGSLKTALYGLTAAVVTGCVAQVSGACPELISQAPAILTAAIGAAIALAWPAQGKARATVAGLGAASLAALVQQVQQICGGDFITQLPALLSAGAFVGLGAYLRTPHGPKA